MLRLQPHLLAHLAEQGLLERFARIHPALRKLPGPGNRRPLANQQAAGRIHHQRGDIWAVANHAGICIFTPRMTILNFSESLRVALANSR